MTLEPNLLYLLLGLITFIGWGSGDIFTVMIVRRINVYLATFWAFFFSALLTSLYIPFAPNHLTAYTPLLLAINLLLGFIFVYGNFLVAEAFSLSSASLVGVIIQSFPAVVLVASAIFFKTPVGPLQWLLISIVFLGVFLCSVNFADFKKQGLIVKDKGVKSALLAALLLSGFFTALPVLINQIDWFWPNYLAILTFPLLLVLIKRKQIKFSFTKNKLVAISILMAAFLIRTGDIALNYGLSVGAGAVVAPLSGAAPILFVILAAIIFKDKVTRQQKLGIVVTLLGIVLLNTVGLR